MLRSFVVSLTSPAAILYLRAIVSPVRETAPTPKQVPRESYPPAVWDGTTEVLEDVVGVKSRYCRFLDTQDWARWSALFLPDATLQMGPSQEAIVHGRDEIEALLRSQLRKASTLHQVRDPELREEGLGRVRIIWRMKDRVETPLYLLEGAGFYDDVYVQTPEGWRIESLRLHRTKVAFTPKSFVMKSVLNAHRNGLLRYLSPSADRTLGEALHVGLRPGQRP
ncbi:MAG: nuclear transport factor 2 family protein [Myxococcota bacterium]